MTTSRAVPLTCHGHSRPITHLNFSPIVEDGTYYLFSACKDNNPILRNGRTGDWIGTFLGHKGAVWSAKLSDDVKLAATGSADYTAKIWNALTGEAVHHLQHEHIVRSVAFVPTGAGSGHGGVTTSSPKAVITGGAERKLRLWDLRIADLVSSSSSLQSGSSPTITQNYQNGSSQQPAIELGAGTHKGTIKSIVFSVDNPNVFMTAAEDDMPNVSKIRWFDIRGGGPLAEHAIGGTVGSCELNVRPQGMGSNQISSATGTVSDPEAAVLSVAAGKAIYFFSGYSQYANTLLRRIDDLPRDSSCVSLDIGTRKFVAGCKDDTHVHVYDYDDKTEVELGRGHHGPVWSTAFSPDGALYATGSEDGTIKLWKWTEGQYGLWGGE